MAKGLIACFALELALVVSRGVDTSATEPQFNFNICGPLSKDKSGDRTVETMRVYRRIKDYNVELETAQTEKSRAVIQLDSSQLK